MEAVLSETTIRVLTREEIPLCVQGGQSFYAEIHLPGKFSAPCFVQAWQNFYDQQMGVIIGLWQDEQLCGAMGGLVHGNPNTGDLTAVECFWYVLPEFRGARKGIQLIQAFTDWSRERGATQLIMVFVHGRKDSKLDELYRRLGFRALETNYVKDL